MLGFPNIISDHFFKLAFKIAYLENNYMYRAPTLPGKPWKPGICHFLFQAWKMPGICSKSSKTQTQNSNSKCIYSTHFKYDIILNLIYSKINKVRRYAYVKTWNFNSKPGKKLEICEFYVSSFTFQNVIYKNNSDLLLFHIYIINTNTDSKPNWPWISLLLPEKNLENTWKFVSQEKWEPWLLYV